jgi:perosamine synthetase
MININEPYFSEQGVSDVVHAIESKQWVMGENVKKLEQKVCSLTGMKHAVAFCNATAAIEVALRAIRPHRKAQVITPSLTFRSAITSILRAGCEPVFADITEDYTVDTNSVKSLLTEDTVAIIGTDMFGFPCHASKLREIADTAGIDFIEDASQAIGAKSQGVHIGRVSDIIIFSFYATKNVGCGEGGILATNDSVIYHRSKDLRQGAIYEWEHSYMSETVAVGTNLRMSEILAPLALDGLNNIYDLTAVRRRNASRLHDYLDTPHPHNVVGKLSSWNTYPILHDDRDGLVEFLGKSDIQAKPYYDYLLNYDPLYQKRFAWQETPKALEISKRIVSLPVHHKLNDIHMKFIAEKVKEYEPATA